MPIRGAFAAACLMESALLAAAVGGNWLFRPAQPLRWELDLTALAMGVLAIAPPLVLFAWTLFSRSRLMTEHREIMMSRVKALFEGWSLPQLAVISLLAGICEEAFFRGFLQDGLSPRAGSGWAVVLAALIFGGAHLLSCTYGALAALIGAYLGMLYLWTGNLLVPMTAHAVYDFIALVWLLKGSGQWRGRS